MKTKERHQKLFNDKFIINTNDKILKCLEVSNEINLELKRNKKSILTQDELKNILVQNNKYIGCFYASPNIVNYELSLNLEDVYLDLSKLNKQNHNENCWAYDNNEYQKFFVLENNGKKALIATTYKDSFAPIIFDVIDTDLIGFEGNIAVSMLN